LLFLLPLFVILAPVAAASPASAPVKPLKIAVLDIQAKGDVVKGRADIFSELLQTEVRSRGHEVIGRSDIEQVLGLERMKDSLGCTSTTCMAEIGGALGVDELLSGSVVKLGSYLVVNLRRIEPKKARVLRNAERRVKNGGDDALIEIVSEIVDALYGAAPERGASVVQAPPPVAPTGPSARPKEAAPAGFTSRTVETNRKPSAGAGFQCFPARQGSGPVMDFCYDELADCVRVATDLRGLKLANWQDIGACKPRPLAHCLYREFDARLAAYLPGKLQCFAEARDCSVTHADHLKDPTKLKRLESCVPASSWQDAKSVLVD
jgi:hypothetical protein